MNLDSSVQSISSYMQELMNEKERQTRVHMLVPTVVDLALTGSCTKTPYMAGVVVHKYVTNEVSDGSYYMCESY